MKKMFFLLAMFCVFALPATPQAAEPDEPKTVQEAAERFFSFYPVIVDTRSANEYRDNHIRGAVNLDWFDPVAFDRFVVTTPKHKPLLVYSLVHWRGARMAERLREAGFVNAIGLTGGLEEWIKAGYPVYSYTSGSEQPMSIDEYMKWNAMPRIVIEYKALCPDYEKAQNAAEALVLKYPGQLRMSVWKFSSEWPQRTPEQLEAVKDSQVVVSLVSPGNRKYYEGVPDGALLEKDIREVLQLNP